MFQEQANLLKHSPARGLSPMVNAQLHINLCVAKASTTTLSQEEFTVLWKQDDTALADATQNLICWRTSPNRAIGSVFVYNTTTNSGIACLNLNSQTDN